MPQGQESADLLGQTGSTPHLQIKQHLERGVLREAFKPISPVFLFFFSFIPKSKLTSRIEAAQLHRARDRAQDTSSQGTPRLLQGGGVDADRVKNKMLGLKFDLKKLRETEGHRKTRPAKSW